MTEDVQSGALSAGLNQLLDKEQVYSTVVHTFFALV
jgi:hypothetical protein